MSLQSPGASDTRTLACAVTGIGSLPFHDFNEAVEFVLRVCPRLPYLPEVVHDKWRAPMLVRPVSELLDLLWEVPTGELAFLKRDRNAVLTRLREELPELAEVRRFADALRVQGSSALAIKAQGVGPVTLMRSLRCTEDGAVADRELAASVLQRIVNYSRASIEPLKRFGVPVIYLLDEPSLPAVASRGAADARIASELLGAAILALQEEKVLVGIHCCASWPLPEVATAGDIVSFDATVAPESWVGEPQMQKLMRRGGIAALGVVPTTSLDSTSARSEAQRLRRALEEAQMWLPSQLLLSPSCGLAGSTPTEAEAVFALLDEIARDWAVPPANL